MKESILLKKQFRESSKSVAMPTEAEIQEALRKYGMDSPERQLNCGACGFKTCRDKAIAVCRTRNS